MNTDFFDPKSSSKSRKSLYSRRHRLSNFSSLSELDQTKFKKPIFSVKRPQKTYITMEQALEYAGDNSTYSKKILFLISFFWIWYSFLVMGIPLFMGGKSTFFCPYLDEHIFHQCSEYEACNKYNINDIIIQPKYTLISEFKLVCNRSYLVAWIGSIIYMSNILSGFIFPYLSDRHGRKKTILFSGFLASLSLLAAGFADEFIYWIICVFLGGFGFGGLETTGRVYLSEISAKNFRFNSSTVLNITWASSQIVFGILLIVVKYWRYIFIFGMGLCFLSSLIYGIFMMDESPRWLIYFKEYDKAKTLLKKITEINKRPPFEFNFTQELINKNQKLFKKIHRFKKR